MVGEEDLRDTVKHFSFNINRKPTNNEKLDLSLINPDFGVISGIDRNSSVKETNVIRHSLNLPKLTDELDASDSFNNRVSNPSESESQTQKLQQFFANTSVHNESVDKKSGHFQSPGFRNKNSSGLEKNPSTGGSNKAG